MKESANRLASGTVGRALLVPTVATFLLIASLSPASACVARISNLGGNVAGPNISGTNVWVRMYVYNSTPNCDHVVSAYLGPDIMAGSPIHLKVNPPAYTVLWHILRTDTTGKWQSEDDQGYVKFDTTAEIMDGNDDYLRIRLSPWGGTAFYSNNLDYTGDGNPDEVQVYNKAYVLSDANLVNRATADKVHGHCHNMKHSVVPGTGGQRTYPSKATILGNLRIYTVFYIATHGEHTGGVTYFQAADGGGWISSSEVDEYVRGNPPKGKRGIDPYYNIVHIDACDSAQGFDMAAAFDIVSGVGGKKPNRAYVGWLDEVYGNQDAADWTDCLWEGLVAGYTIGQAKNYADGEVPEVSGSAELEGDKKATLHSVYGGEMG